MNEYAPKRRRNDSFGQKLWAWAKRFFMVIGIMVTLSMIITTTVVTSQMRNLMPKPVEDNTVLIHTFEGAIPETLTIQNPKDLFDPPPKFNDIVRAIRNASEDDKVKVFAATIKPNTLNLAQIQELRAAIKMFRDAGKQTHVFATSFGDFSPGMSAYYLASAFENIWMQPIGNVSITGISGEMPFFKGGLDKLGVTAELYTRAEYKTAAEPMTRAAPSAENTEMTKRLLGGIYNTMVADIAQDRGIEVSTLKSLVDRAPIADQDAEKSGLINHIAYLDEMVDAAEDLVGGEDEAKLVSLSSYNARNDFHRKDAAPSSSHEHGHDHEEDETIIETVQDETVEEINLVEGEPIEVEADGTIVQDSIDTNTDEASAEDTGNDEAAAEQDKDYGNRIAVVYGAGMILPSSEAMNAASAALVDVLAPVPGIGGGAVISAEDMIIALGDARKDDEVSAVVIRLDTPGGSATASETIARAVERLQDEGKPVVISMGGSAASGGYWIAAKADKILAQPSTLTGSIGVLGGKVTVGGLMNKLGVNIAEFSYGANADMWSSTKGFDESATRQVNQLLDTTYNAFLTRVSEGRDIPLETLRSEIAGGRVWTGAEAIDIGLVDQLGGLHDAIEVAEELAGLTEDDHPIALQYPPEKSRAELFLDLLGGGGVYSAPFSGVTLGDTKQALQQMGALSAYRPLPRIQ